MSVIHERSDLFDDHGFLAKPDLWNRDLALRIAAQLGLRELTESHWLVIDYLREHYVEKSALPWEEHLCRELDLVRDCVHRLFGGAIEAWQIAGLPDPGEEARTYMLNMET
jgi:tRNA 2-thiouridine synthesizing protein E